MRLGPATVMLMIIVRSQPRIVKVSDPVISQTRVVKPGRACRPAIAAAVSGCAASAAPSRCGLPAATRSHAPNASSTCSRLRSAAPPRQGCMRLRTADSSSCNVPSDVSCYRLHDMRQAMKQTQKLQHYWSQCAVQK